jgi:acetylornithine deacetylase/succinyl-diaminopimelate desuccinylase-like protein
MNNIKQYVQEIKTVFTRANRLLKIPSVSADSYSQDVIDTADAVKASLEKAGCKTVEICDTPGYPIVYGEHIIDPEFTNRFLWSLRCTTTRSNRIMDIAI